MVFLWFPPELKGSFLVLGIDTEISARRCLIGGSQNGLVTIWRLFLGNLADSHEEFKHVHVQLVNSTTVNGGWA